MKDLTEMDLEEFKYELAPSLIADFPLAERDASRLLIYKDGNIQDDLFKHLPSYLPQRATIVLNNTQVIEARVFFEKPTGGVIEIFILEPYDSNIAEAIKQTKKVTWKCLIGGASKWKPKELLLKIVNIQNAFVELKARYIEKQTDHFIIEFEWGSLHSFTEVLKAAGEIPLPPYIKRKAIENDAITYQTIFAEKKGSVAAPTASLHFTTAVFNALKEKNIYTSYVTLHVGAGTFKPIKTSRIIGHQMHAENFSVTATSLSELLNADVIVAGGTTSLRTLESLYWLGVKLIKNHLFDNTLQQWEAYDLHCPEIKYKDSLRRLLDYMQQIKKDELFCRTSLLIVPGYSFRSADALITNFHQPLSTLLLLVAAFIGKDWEKVYDHAVKDNYRFLSYGDSSLLWRKD
jgi:S-adenosylmethionine:tRNA ribosyltransferase-isomerase